MNEREERWSNEKFRKKRKCISTKQEQLRLWVPDKMKNDKVISKFHVLCSLISNWQLEYKYGTICTHIIGEIEHICESECAGTKNTLLYLIAKLTWKVNDSNKIRIFLIIFEPGRLWHLVILNKIWRESENLNWLNLLLHLAQNLYG